MGQFVSLKITAQELAEHGMTSLPGTQWKNQAEMLKAKLDEDGTFVAQRLGQILDLLELSIAAASIGADIPSVATKTVQGVLSSFEAAIASRYTKTEADTLISGNTNNLMESLTFNDQTGVFTIRKKDGTVSTIDTVLEKVPVSMTFETVGGATRIKLVNQDGSTSCADVSSLVDNYAFNNSTTVAFNITGVGNKRVLEAYVRDHSITLTHLDLAAVTELQNYVASASHSATAAANSAAGASTSEANALVSKQDAAASATNAAASASNASISATNAEASKNAAASSETATFNSKNAAATSATTSQSWAVGGTGTRVGEDANNAKYWSDRAAAVVGQKVATFNGRDGVVIPEAGDYTPEMVGATPAGHGTDETKHLGVLAKTSPADTDSMALVDSADGDKLKRVSWSNVKSVLGLVFAPLAHKARHAVGGIDAITPADIGAAPASNGIPYVLTTGSANAYTVTLPGASAYTDGMALSAKINASNTGTATINVNGLGTKTIKDSKGQDLKSGTLTANSICTLRYNGTNFILQGEGSDLSVGLTATASTIVVGKTALVNGNIVSGMLPDSYGLTATAANIAQGKTALVNGSIVTGTLIVEPPLIRHPDGFDYKTMTTVTIPLSDIVVSPYTYDISQKAYSQKFSNIVRVYFNRSSGMARANNSSIIMLIGDSRAPTPPVTINQPINCVFWDGVANMPNTSMPNGNISSDGTITINRVSSNGLEVRTGDFVMDIYRL